MSESVKRGLSVTSALALLVLGLVAVVGSAPAGAEDISGTGPVSEGCEKIEGSQIGDDGAVVVIGDVSIALSNWQGGSGEFFAVDYSVSGLEAGQTVEYNIKAGQGETEGTLAGSGTISVSGQTAISNITFCVFGETGSTSTSSTSSTSTSTSSTSTSTSSTSTSSTSSTSTSTSSTSSTSTSTSSTTSTTSPAASTTSTTATGATTAVRVGRIVIQKVTSPTGAAVSFGFVTSYAGTVTLSDGQTHTSGDLAPGIYSVSESLTSAQEDGGWNLDSATCSDGSPVSAIDLSAGETVTCVFQNSIIQVLGVQVTSTTSTTAAGAEVGAVTAETLPFTGFAGASAAVAGLLALGSGGLALLAARRRNPDGSDEGPPEFRGWNRH